MKNQNEKIRSFEKAILSDLDRAGESPAVARLRERFAKRFAPSDIKSLHTKALSDFLTLNDSVIPPNLEGINPVIIGEAQQFIWDALTRFTWSYSDVRQCELDWTLLFDLWRLGPGTSNGVRGATHFCDKITKPMTSTKRALPLVRLLRRLTPRLKASDLGRPKLGEVVELRGSRLSSVAKNQTTNRTMAIEPSGNMALQLAAGMYIQGALKRVGLDITTQESKNKTLAYLGSLTGSLCTIDLKSASDLISIDLVKLLWPQSWYQLFMTTRSNECCVNGNWIELRMMSTMGNGFTFPMMTLTLLALLYGYQRSVGYLKNNRVDFKTTGVYGDDIICPTEHFTGFTELLTAMGLRVNLEKSYSEGPFRESCGGDFHTGVDITPFYVESLDSDTEIYVAINKLLLWSSRHEIVLGATLTYFRSLLVGPVYLIPEWEDPSRGVLSLYPKRRYKLLMKVLKPKRRPLITDLDVMSLIGGYAVPVVRKGDRHFIEYTTRDAPCTIEVKNARLPKGYLDGHDPYYTSRGQAEFRDKVISLFII